MRKHVWALFAVTALILTACGGAKYEPYQPGDAVQGLLTFQATCATCHGLDARGIQDKGADLTAAPSDKVAGLTPEQLYDWLWKRHDPLIPKLPKITAQNIRDAEAYLLTLRPTP